jgi:hypothetical protein
VLMRQGTPLHVMDNPEFRGLLEEQSFRLGGADSLAQLIPASVSVELSTLVHEIDGRWVAFVFDGTTRWAEVYAVLALFVDALGRLQRRLIKLSLLERSLNSDELARYLMATVRSMGVENDHIVALISDRASTNTAAIDMMLVFLVFCIFIGCCSHTLNNVGKKFVLDACDDFMTAFQSMQRSKGARKAWSDLTGVFPTTYSDVRWWSLLEEIQKVWDHRDCLDQFVANCDNEDLADRSIARMKSVLDDPTSRLTLFLQMATGLDAGTPFVQATYNLEGDEFLAPFVYEVIQHLDTFISTFQPILAEQYLRDNLPHLPEASRLDLLAACRAMVQPGFDYFRAKFIDPGCSLEQVVQVYKAAMLVNPTNIHALAPFAQARLDLLPPRIDAAMKTTLMAELPEYLTAATLFPLQAGRTIIEKAKAVRTFWNGPGRACPAWRSLSHYLQLLQPSSAAVERVFSEFKALFSPQQSSTLQDAIQLSLMLRINSRNRLLN